MKIDKKEKSAIVDELVGLYLTKVIQRNAWILGKAIMFHIIGIVLLFVYCQFWYTILGLGLYYLTISQLYKAYVRLVTKRVEEELQVVTDFLDE